MSINYAILGILSYKLMIGHDVKRIIQVFRLYVKK